MKFKMKNLLASNDIKSRYFSIAIAVLLGLLSTYGSAGETFKHGAVMARSIVLDENKQPILVEYNEDGTEGSLVSIPNEYQNDIRRLTIISAAEYNAEKARLDAYKTRYADTLAVDAEVVLRDNFDGMEYLAADGSVIFSPNLPEYVKSVLVRGRSNRISKDPSQLVLLTFSVDLSQNYNAPDKGSLLLDPFGRVIYSSPNNIAPRVGFFGDPNEKQEFFTVLRKREDTIFGPVAGAKVFVSPEVFPGSLAMTDEKGKYSMHFRLPYCPGGFEFTTDVWVELRYANFNANGMPSIPYSLRRQDWTYCFDLPPPSFSSLAGASAYLNAMGVVATMAIPVYNIDFKVDVMFLSGKVTIKNPDGSSVEINNTTEYAVDSPSNDPASIPFDLDGDGHQDAAVLGNIVTATNSNGGVIKTFEQSPDAQSASVQGVYLSSRGFGGAPHLFRPVDKVKNLSSNGVLKSISKEDLKNTDVMVFRESTGQLVLERRGMRDEEIDSRNDTGLGKDDKHFYYRLMLRGPMDGALNVGAIQRTGTWQEWAARYKLTEPFQKREADHLKAGEWVRLVVINRATGYMGTQRLQLNNASENSYGFLSLPVRDIVLMPPNLKIWAERSYSVEKGLTQDEERRFLIGAEGTGLASDNMIEVYTEWYDEEGRTLPEGLGADDGEQFGLTGRLAKVVGSGQISAVAVGGMANFPISPGRKTQVLKVRDNLTTPEHYYIHVSGTQKDENPSFDAGNATAELDGRPKTLTPFLTPVYYEQSDWHTISDWNAARRAFNEETSATPTRPLKPSPEYHWTYRTEYQFSQYELEIKELERTTSSGTKVDLLNDPLSEMGLTDQWLDIFYSLIGNNNDRLNPVDGNQDLVLAIGGEEIKLSLDEDGHVRFDNAKHLETFNPEDFLSIRLYSNQDAGNVLWEYAFESYGESKFSRTHSQAQYNDQSAYTYETIDSYNIFNVPLETESVVSVDILDHEKKYVSRLIPNTTLSFGLKQFVVVRKDLDVLQSRSGIDGYLVVRTMPMNGNRSREKFYELHLSENINGEMLGQVIEHDTLIQRGSLTLSRQDLSLPSHGPQLDFVRSFSNDSKPENSHAILSPGWSHNHNIYVQVLAWGDDQPPYINNLPGWIGDTRAGVAEPEILDAETISNLRNRPMTPSVVAVSNGGSFKRVINNWINQRGNHGTISRLANGGWEYRSKDGTLYTFEPLQAGEDKAFVSLITDRNGNTLKYQYTTVNGERLLLGIIDSAARELAFSYSRADNGKMRLSKVESSVDIDLEFDYFPKPASGYDARVGMLKSFSRGDFTETYDYRRLNEDPSVNLSTVVDANGNVTRYEYYDADDVPVDMAGFARGLDENDIVHKVFYPSATGSAYAELKYPATSSSNKREIFDLLGNKKTYLLNGLGNPIKLDEPENKSTTFEWSADMGEPDNLLRKKTDVATNANWEYEYDAHGNLTKEKDPYGKITEQSWDQHFSVLLYRKDKNDNTLEQNLDAKGNVLTEKQTAHVNGSKSFVVTNHTYMNMGELKGLLKDTTDGRSSRTSFTYDNYGNVASVKEGEGSETTYDNNARGLRLSQTDANGNKTTYEYDDLDRLTKTTDAEGNSTSYQYDNKGNKKSEEIRDGYLVDGAKQNRYLKLTYTYDPRDRVSLVAREGNLGGSHSVSGSKTYSYDANSNLLTETDWKGVETSHTYDPLNRRTSTTNRSGNSMSYAYEFNDGVKTTTTDYEGRVTIEHADKLGRKTKIVHPTVSNSDGTPGSYERVMTYDNLTNVIAVRDENNNTTQFDYDARNLKIKQTNALGKAYQWQYDAAGNLSKTIDELNRATNYVYDKQNRLIEKTAPESKTWKYSYNENGTLKTETDPWNIQYSYTYDKVNQRTGVTHPDGTDTESYTKDGKLVFKKDAEGRSIRNLYGVDDRLLVATDARGRTTTNTFDENNNLTDSVVAWSGAATGPAEVTTHNEYDAEDRVIASISANGSSVAQRTEYAYDKLGNRTQERRPNARVTAYEYDELNRVKRITSPTVDGLNNETFQVWDGLGNQIAVTDRRGNTTTTEYDALNRPIKVTDADNKFISYTYDDVSNKLTEINRRGKTTRHTYDGLNRELERFVVDGGTSFRLLANEYDIDGQKKNAVTDANNNRVESEQDWRGNALVTTLPAGSGYTASTLTNIYDKSGFLISATDAAGFTTTYTYYADGSVASSINAESETTAFAYDLFGNKATITKPMSGVQTLAYDEQNRLVEVTDALDGQTRFEYDQNNNLVRQFLPAANDGGSTQVEYVYDLLNRKREHIQHKSGDNLVSLFKYDAEGNLLETIDPKGQKFTNTYDVLNRLSNQSFPSGSDVTSIATTYDANGNVDTITETKGSNTEVTSHSYDLLDRLSSQTQRGRSISYAYDNNGNRTRVTSIGGVTNYTYDSRNRLSTVNGNTSYSYLQNGWLEEVTHANGTKASYTYDNTGRVTTITNTLANNNVLSSFAYTYDDNGNRIQQVEVQNGFLTVQTLTTDYRYDELDRLEGFSEAGTGQASEHSFTYYPSYDRKTETVVNNGTTLKNRTYSYNETYWLTGIAETAGTGGSISYQYDNNGNSTRKTDSTSGATQSTVFEYNSRNQLTRVAHGAPGAEVGQGTHDYNYAGMRIRHLGSERGDIEYLYDGDSILDEVQNNSSTLVAHYRYGDRLLSLTSGGSDQFYHYAGLGTTANLTNAAGVQQVAYRTDPFGEITQQEGTSVNRQVFTGQEHDEKTGLIYFGARFYDPDTARFINQDSYLGESSTPPSLHRYLYAYSNPTVWVDPTGHASFLSDWNESTEQRTEWYGNEIRNAKSGWAAVGYGFMRGFAELESAVATAMNATSNLIAQGYDERSNQDLIATRSDISNSIESTDQTAEYVKNNPAAAAKGVHQSAVNFTADLMSGDREALGSLGTMLTPTPGAASKKVGSGLSNGLSKAKQLTSEFKSKIDAGSQGTKETPNISSGSSQRPDMGNSVAAQADADAGMPYSHLVKSKVNTSAERRAYLNEKYGRSGDIHKDINVRQEAYYDKLAYQNINGSGKTVLGTFPSYIDKAKKMNANYFDIGMDWYKVPKAQRWGLNERFMDKVTSMDNQIYFSIPKTKISTRNKYSLKEIDYLTKEKDYQWLNQWSLKSKNGGNNGKNP